MRETGEGREAETGTNTTHNYINGGGGNEPLLVINECVENRDSGKQSLFTIIAVG